MQCVIAFKASEGCLAANIKQIFVQNLCKKIESQGLSGVQFAKAIGVSQANVSKWINGIAYPEIHHIQKMIDVFKWDPEDLYRTKSKDEPAAPDLKTALQIVTDNWDQVELRRKKPKG